MLFLLPSCTTIGSPAKEYALKQCEWKLAFFMECGIKMDFVLGNVRRESK